MAKPDLAKLLNQSEETAPATAHPRPGKQQRIIHKSGEVNISAYFPSEVKAALRHVQAKSGKSIKGCLSEALQLLFRKYNVPVTVPEE
jgi:hypothetical protein